MSHGFALIRWSAAIVFYWTSEHACFWASLLHWHTYHVKLDFYAKILGPLRLIIGLWYQQCLDFGHLQCLSVLSSPTQLSSINSFCTCTIVTSRIGRGLANSGKGAEVLVTVPVGDDIKPQDVSHVFQEKYIFLAVQGDAWLERF